MFAANCATCHGAGGEGQANWHIEKDDGTLPPPPLNGDGHTWHHGDGLLYRVVSKGGQEFEDPRFSSFKSAMPAFGDRLSHDEIVAVLNVRQESLGRQDEPGHLHRGVAGAGERGRPVPAGRRVGTSPLYGG